MTLRNAIGNLWGPSALALKWFYNGCIIPRLSYASIVWARKCLEEGTKTKLQKLNRLAALALAPVRRSTPTSGLEVLYGLPPLDLKLTETALKAFLRILRV